MPKLFRTIYNTDWKGRPDHKLELLGEGDRNTLLALIAADVNDTKTGDLEIENQERAECGDEQLTDWHEDNIRWEMIRTDPNELPTICYNDDGDFSSICYHILD